MGGLQSNRADAGCGLSKGSFANSYTVTSATTPNKFAFSGNGTQIDAYFSLGEITFTSGQNNGISRGVRSFVNANQLFTLYQALPFAPAVGDTFTAYPGCDKTQSTCLNKFNDLVNFGAQPYVPIPETAV